MSVSRDSSKRNSLRSAFVGILSRTLLKTSGIDIFPVCDTGKATLGFRPENQLFSRFFRSASAPPSLIFSSNSSACDSGTFLLAWLSLLGRWASLMERASGRPSIFEGSSEEEIRPALEKLSARRRCPLIFAEASSLDVFSRGSAFLREPEVSSGKLKGSAKKPA